MIIYFDSFGVEDVPKEIEKFIGHKNIKANIFTIQSNNSIMYGYFCIGFIDFIFAGKTLTDFTSLFSSYNFGKNDNIILSYFKNEWNNLSDQTKLRLNEINEIKDYFNSKIEERKIMSKKISKYKLLLII